MPSAAAAIAMGAPTGAPSAPVAAWRSSRRVDVTFSLPDAIGACMAADAALDVAARHGGATLMGPHVGAWQGAREIAYTLSLVGAPAATVLDVFGTLWERGAIALQCEVWDDSRYSVTEYRKG